MNPVRWILMGLALGTFSAHGAAMRCSASRWNTEHRDLFTPYADYYFADMGDPQKFFQAETNEGGDNYGYTQDFRILQFEKNGFCENYCYTITIAEPLPYSYGTRLTIKPAAGFNKGIYRMEEETRLRSTDPWRGPTMMTCIVPEEIAQAR